MSGKKKRKTKGQFAKEILICDLVMLLVFSMWGMVLVSLGIDPSPTLTVIFTVGGGELLLLMIKKIFKDKGDENNE